jgi:hypothetical protein
VADTAFGTPHRFEPNFSATSGQAYTMSCFVKANTLTQCHIFGFADNNVFAGQTAIFDLSAGTVVSNAGNGIPKIESYGNGWYRVSLTLTAGATAVGYFGFGPAKSGSVAYLGDGSSLYMWGAQIEAGAYVTSYIPTTTAAVTRVADAASKTGISSLIGQTEGTLFAEFDFVSGETANYALLHQAAFSTYIFINQGVSGTIFGQIQPFGVSFSAAKPNGRYKCALAYKSGDSAFFVNGVQVGTTNTTTFTPATMDIFNFTADPHTNSNYQALLFKTRLTNAQLAELTTL